MTSAATKRIATIRRVLRGQWANEHARSQALDALEELESEVTRLQRQYAVLEAQADRYADRLGKVARGS